jgi:hypothetical protein
MTPLTNWDVDAAVWQLCERMILGPGNIQTKCCSLRHWIPGRRSVADGLGQNV